MYTLLKKFPTGEQAHNYNFQNPKKKVVLGGMTPPPQHSDWPKKVKFYEKGHFIAQIDTKMDNKQQKHDLVNCPLFLKKAANPPPPKLEFLKN